MNSVDSSGAGDAFIGSFAVFLGEGIGELDAVRRANLYAGLSTTGSERKNLFMIAHVSMRSGQREIKTGVSSKFSSRVRPRRSLRILITDRYRKVDKIDRQ